MKIFAHRLVAFTVLLLSSAAPVMAQDSSTQALIDRIERMDRDIKSLNLKVYRNTSPATDAAQGAEANQSISSTPIDNNEGGAIAARLSIRMNELESQMRQMTGQLEETTFRISELTTRLDRLVSDMDYRLSTLEGKPVSQTSSSQNNVAGQEGSTVTAPQGISANTLSSPVKTQQTPSVSDEEGVLGTLSQSDLKAGANQPASPQSAATQALSAEDLYQSSRKLLMAGEYAQAETSFQSFLTKYEDHQLAGNARYWLGETYYVQGNFPQAASTFLEGYQKAPRGAKAPDSLLKLGMSLRQLDKTKEACATFSKLRADFPKMPAHLSKTFQRENAAAKCS